MPASPSVSDHDNPWAALPSDSRHWDSLLADYSNRTFCALPLVPDSDWNPTNLHYPIFRPRNIAVLLFVPLLGLLLIVGCFLAFYYGHGNGHLLVFALVIGPGFVLYGISPLLSVRSIALSDRRDQILLTHGWGPWLKIYPLPLDAFRLQITFRNNILNQPAGTHACLELLHVQSLRSIILAAGKQKDISPVCESLASILHLPWEIVPPAPVILPDGSSLDLSRAPPVASAFSRRKIVFHSRQAVVKSNLAERIIYFIFLAVCSFALIGFTIASFDLSSSPYFIFPTLAVVSLICIFLIIRALRRGRIVMDLAKRTLTGHFTRVQGSDGRSTIPLSEIVAVQICLRKEAQRSAFTFLSSSQGENIYQLLLVLNSPPGSRRFLICNSDFLRLRTCADQLSAFLNVILIDDTPKQ